MTPLVVLIVDDDTRNRKLARDLLVLDGIGTLEAAGGVGAIAIAKEQRPDLVLLDLHLSDLLGTEVLRRLRADASTASVRVVALTALAGADDAMLAAGFDGYLSKPIDALAFAAQVRDLAAGGCPPLRSRGQHPGRAS
jgi:CheY-like chemotaxis protein